MPIFKKMLIIGLTVKNLYENYVTNWFDESYIMYYNINDIRYY